MGSEDYATSNSNPSGDDGSSLAARRARLRGTLAKQAAPPDPYKPDPYLMAEPAANQNSAQSQASTAPAPTPPTSSTSAPQAPSTSSPLADSPSPQAFLAQDAASASGLQGEVTHALNLPSEPTPPVEPAQVPSSSFSDFTSSMFQTEPSQDLPAAMPPADEPPVEKPRSNGSGTGAPTLSSASFFASAAPSDAGNRADISNRTDLTRNEETASIFSAPEVESVPEPEPETTAPPAPTRADRRKQSGAQATVPAIPDAASIPPAVDPDSIVDLNYMSAPAVDAAPSSVVASEDNSHSGSATSIGNYTYSIQSADEVDSLPPTALQSQALEIMTNIDQAMGACAMNLSELQKIAGEQTEALKGVAETLQNQSFFEMGLNLNSLVDTLAAALEPMKAVGELVPAIDQLVAMMESREVNGGAPEESTKLSREQLVTSLAEQLSTGMIDPWTFKCAYMAVFPAEHPADLLHRLVDLLGTQRLSGDLFRAAYDAVQAPDPPPRMMPGGEGGETKTVVQMVQDEALLAQLDELKRMNELFMKRNDEISHKLDAKDEEFNQVLATKEAELQEAQELLNSRWEEFNARYDELTETLHKRDEALQEREAELAKKESENAQLRSQMEELRDQTKEMVADLQRQLSAKPKEEAPKQPGFFDAVPAGAQQAPQQAPTGQLFDAGPSRPLFGQTDQPQQAAPMEPQQQQMAPQAPQQSLQQPMAPPQPAQAPANNQAVPRPAAPTTPFVSGAGSYGSGVRAQVFEVIVRQALAGAPWREICAGPMQVNNISPEEVETEVKRRQALLKK